MCQPAEVAAFEETFPNVLDAALHPGLVLGMAHHDRFADEAAVLGAFQEAAGEPGMQRVDTSHRRREIVHDQVPGDAAEEGPGHLQSGDDVFQLLAEGGPDEAVPAVGQHHDQGPHRAAAARLRVWIRPRRPKSSSATSPGALSAIRTVPGLRRRQLRRATNRCSEA